jgi:tetratricopeptide (TPR) repeat protein
LTLIAAAGLTGFTQALPSARAQEATPPEAPAAQEAFQARFERFDAGKGLLHVTIPPSDKSAFRVTGEVAARLAFEFEKQLIEAGDYIEAVADGDNVVANYRVLSPQEILVKVKSRSSGPDMVAGGVSMEKFNWAQGLERGQKVRVNDKNYVFNSFDLRSKMLVLNRPGQAGGVVLPLAKVVKHETIAPDAEEATGKELELPGFGAIEVKLKAGDEMRGTVTDLDRQVKTFEVQFLDKTRKTIALKDVEGWKKIQAEDLIPEVTQVETPEPEIETPEPITDEEDSILKAVLTEPRLDTTRNETLLSGYLQHKEQGKLLLAATVRFYAYPQVFVDQEAEKKYLGWMARPEFEQRVIEKHRGRRLPEEGILDKGQRYMPYYPGGDLDKLLLLDPGTRVDEQHLPVEVIFPNTMHRIEFVTEVFNPRVEVKPEYDPSGLISFDDPAATYPLMRAYGTDLAAAGALSREQKRDRSMLRETALQAMAQSGDGVLLPFLFWRYYLEDGDPEQLATAIARFDTKAREYLHALLIDEQWKTGIRVPDVDGSWKVHTPRIADDAIASALELVNRTGPTQTSLRAGIRYVESPYERLRKAARALFLDNPDSVTWLVQAMVTTPAARKILLEIGETDPQILAGIYQNVVKPQNLAFLEAVALKGAEEQASDYLGRIYAYVRDNPNDLVPQLFEANAAAERVLSVLSHRRVLQEEAAIGIVNRPRSKPPADRDAREHRVALLRHAIDLAPDSDAAKQELGVVLREIVGELRKGPSLRAGPGVEWSPIQPIRRGDVFKPTESRRIVNGWIPVLDASDQLAYVHGSLGRVGSRSVIVLENQRSPEDMLDILREALELDTVRRDAYETELAALQRVRGLEAAKAGRWDQAVKAFGESYALRPNGPVGLSLLGAYLHEHPWVPASILLLLFVLLVTFLVRPQKAKAAAAAPRLQLSP